MAIKLNNRVPAPPHNTGITGGITGINNEVPDPPHNTGTTGGMKLPDTKSVKSISVPKKIFAPTKEQLRAAYRSIAQQAFSSHTAKKLKHPPKGAAKAEGVDITPKGLRGVGWKAYAVGMKLYVTLTPVAPHPKSIWYAVGSIPMF